MTSNDQARIEPLILGVKAAEAAKAAAEAARVEGLMKTPLWMHGARCGVTVFLILWGTSYLSSFLHRRADKLREDELNKIKDDEVSCHAGHQALHLPRRSVSPIYRMRSSSLDQLCHINKCIPLSKDVSDLSIHATCWHGPQGRVIDALLLQRFLLL